jgi:hypothetical protein
MNRIYRMTTAKAMIILVQALWLCAAALAQHATLPSTADATQPAVRFKLATRGLTVGLSEPGELVSARLGKRKLTWPIRASTFFVQCTNISAVSVARLPGGGIEFTRRIAHRSDAAKQAKVIQRLVPQSDSIRWELEVIGEGSPWSTGIETQLKWPNPAAQWWTAWDDPEQQREGWRDPLVFRPLTNAQLWLGETHWDETRPPTGYQPGAGRLVIPLVTIAEPELDSGLSLVLSPEDTIFELSLTVRPDGALVFRRLDNRISTTNRVRFALDLIAHEADWRPALGWMTRRYGAYFQPPNPQAADFVGLGAYSDWEGDLPVEKLKHMGFRVNWKASYDFPYMGMFLPPLPDDVPYTRLVKNNLTSIAQLREYSHRMKAMGFSVLNYFNVTEFGATAGMPKAADPSLAPADRWKNVHSFMQEEVNDGILLDLQGRRYSSWEGCVVMDCGAPKYRAFLLEQARRHLEKLPDSAGICIDRLDWLRWYNFKADDGLSWRRDQPVRSLYYSWRSLLSELGPMMHASNKVIFVNAMINRTDLMRHVDGIYHEFGHFGRDLNGTALQCVLKPAIAWTPDENALKPDPDAFFQRYLYLGVYPTAPLPANDHTILPSEWADSHYLAYGPLFDLLRGRQWILKAHAVEVSDGSAKANLFRMGEDLAVPVVLAGTNEFASIRIRHQDWSLRAHCRAIYPGTAPAIPISSVLHHGILDLKVPMRRGCALVLISPVPSGRDSKSNGRNRSGD